MILGVSKMSEKTAYCIECRKRVPYKVFEVQDFVNHIYDKKGLVIPVKMFESYCSECGSSIYVPEVNDLNVERMEEAVSRYKQAF